MFFEKWKDKDQEKNTLNILSDKDKYHMMSLTCRVLEKKDTNEFIYKREMDLHM